MNQENIRYTCNCGTSIKVSNRDKHLQSALHQSNIEYFDDLIYQSIQYPEETIQWIKDNYYKLEKKRGMKEFIKFMGLSIILHLFEYNCI
jgi:hypothetical protein